MKSLFNSINMAIGMFTILPPMKKVWCEKSAKHIMKIFPIIGLIIGLIWYGVSLILSRFNIGSMLGSTILMVVPFIITGFIHLDGFMDVSDALLSRRPKEEKVRILKDSTVGAFSVISLILVFFMQFASINTILTRNENTIFLILIPIASRSIDAYFLLTKKAIKESYFGNLYKEGTGIVDRLVLIFTYILVLIVSFLIGGIGVMVSILSVLIICILLVRNCEKELGGINGDVSGYIITLSEFVSLIVLAII